MKASGEAHVNTLCRSVVRSTEPNKLRLVGPEATGGEQLVDQRAQVLAVDPRHSHHGARLAAAEAEWAEGGAVRAEAIDALRTCLSTRAWAWNKRKRGLAQSLLGDRPSDRDARLARALVDEVELLVRTVTQRLGEERIAEWWERAGIAEVVAPNGTAVTEAQLERMWRLDPNPILCFDGDSAGQKAAMKAFGEDQRWASQSFVAVAPDGMDPCDLRLAKGDDAVKALVEDAVPMFEFAVRTTITRFDL